MDVATAARRPGRLQVRDAEQHAKDAGAEHERGLEAAEIHHVAGSSRRRMGRGRPAAADRLAAEWARRMAMGPPPCNPAPALARVAVCLAADNCRREGRPGHGQRRLRIGVAGAGHFGRYHALKVAARSGPCWPASTIPTRNAPRRSGGRRARRRWPSTTLLAASDALIVAAPAEAHSRSPPRAAGRAARAGGKADRRDPRRRPTSWRALAAERGLVLQVGHLVRFSAAHRRGRGRMGRPLYIEATRIAPFKPRGTDVSVILDLMIHDLDLILSLVDSPIESVDAVGAAVASPHEDIANARVRFANGSVATITASRISFRTERRMRLFAQNGYLTVDFANRRLTAIARERGLPIPQAPEFGMEDSWEEHDALAAEHAAFFAAVLDGAPVVVDAAAGRGRWRPHWL